MKGRRQAIVMFIVFTVLFALLFRFGFVVRNVVISGQSDVAEDVIIRAAGISLGKSIFTVDRLEAQEGVNALGTIELTGMRLRYPSTVELNVRLRSREAMLLYGGNIVVLDENAVVVQLLEDVPDRDMLYISGFRATAAQPGKKFGGEEEQMAACISVLTAVNQGAADVYVSELNLSDPENMLLITRMGTTVKLGNRENMEKKIAWMKAVVQDLDRRGETGGTLDVSSGVKANFRPAGI
ncbi:MAG: FtsQ-type POTRA domain-containing protein [Clostridia bacterium]|nr:FtsQ-type POTRA domain-containing protein [Clostridia bacterium]